MRNGRYGQDRCCVIRSGRRGGTELGRCGMMASEGLGVAGRGRYGTIICAGDSIGSIDCGRYGDDLLEGVRRDAMRNEVADMVL